MNYKIKKDWLRKKEFKIKKTQKHYKNLMKKNVKITKRGFQKSKN